MVSTTLKIPVQICEAEPSIRDISSALARSDSDTQAEFFLAFAHDVDAFNWCRQSESISLSLGTTENRNKLFDCLLTLLARFGGAPVDVSLKSLVHALEGASANTDECPCWEAACALRRLQNWETAKLRVRGEL